MRGMTRALGIATVAAAFAVVAAAPAVAAEAVAKPTFTKDIAPIFQEKCEACHRTDSIAPMSLVTYEEARPWARSIKTRVVAAPDAAVAHRQDRRHPGLQERSLAERRAGRDDRSLGRSGRAEGRPEGHAGAEGRGRASRAGTSPRCSDRRNPTWSSAPRPWTQKAGAERHVVEADRPDRPDRGALGARASRFAPAR